MKANANLVALNFFHVNDRASPAWDSRVLWSTLVRVSGQPWTGGATSRFLLAIFSPRLAIQFSIRQGGPASPVFFFSF